MIPRVGGVLLSPGGHHGNRGTVYLKAVALTTIALPHAGAQPPLPIAIRVPTRMPTADSFVGMPFMRPTLRMHCPSTLQRHTITEDRQRKVREVGEGSQLLSAFSPSPAGYYVCFCACVCVMGVGVGCKPLCACGCVPRHTCAGVHRYTLST